jgi:hypothetical protein
MDFKANAKDKFALHVFKVVMFFFFLSVIANENKTNGPAQRLERGGPC